MKNKILVLWSGGIDSTGVLYRLLTDPKFEFLDVWAHHFKLVNITKRHIAETRAVNRILKWFENNGFPVGSFKYTESILDFGFVRKIPWDTELCWALAGSIAAADNTVTYVEAGRHGEDPDFSAHPEIVSRIDRVFKLATTTRRRGNVPARNLPVCQHMSKEEIYNYLPKDLQKLVWFCRIPKYYQSGTFEECGTCHTCKDVKTIKENIKNGAV